MRLMRNAVLILISIRVTRNEKLKFDVEESGHKSSKWNWNRQRQFNEHEIWLIGHNEKQDVTFVLESEETQNDPCYWAVCIGN